jgi:hypothetical protein
MRNRVHRRPVPVVFLPLAVAVALAAGACGGSDSDEGAEGTVRLQLAEENNSGQSGTAVISPVDGERTRIVMEVDHPPDLPQPAHVHPGPCGNLGDPIAALESLVNGRSETIVPIALADLQRGGFVVHAHRSEAEFDVSVVCAAIPKAR